MKKQLNPKSAKKPVAVAAKAKIPVHQWTNKDGEVLILKCVDARGRGYGDFQYPLEVGCWVEAPDWKPTNKCGKGLHGWAFGIGIGGGKSPDWKGIWLVIGCKPEDVIHVTEGDSPKDKFRGGFIRYASKPGYWQGATNFILRDQMAWVAHNADGVSSTSGDSSSASTSGDSSSASTSGDSSSASTSGDSSSASTSGDSSSASTSGDSSSASTSGDSSSASTSGDSSSASTSGDSSSASTSGDSSSASTSGDSSSASTSGDSSSASTSGDSSSASTSGYSSSASTSGYSSSASTSGDSSSASTSGDSSSASTSGNCAPAVCSGIGSRAKSGPYGCVVLAWRNIPYGRNEMRCAEVGCGDGSDGKLKANVWYRLNDAGQFAEAA